MYKLCKTEQSAMRQRELELKLVELMESRRFEEITVSEFCAFAEIPRKAFYRYFSSKEGALWALIDHTLLELENIREPGDYRGKHTAERDMEQFFQFWKDQKQLLDALQFSGISAVLLERAVETTGNRSEYAYLLAVDSPRVRVQVMQFAVCGIMMMVIRWHEGGYAESVRDMAETALRILMQPMFSLSQNPS